MYIGLLHTHNLFRWLVFIALILALIFSIIGWQAIRAGLSETELPDWRLQFPWIFNFY